MKQSHGSTRRFSLPSVLGLVTASLVCLSAGALLAVAFEGFLRILFAGVGFSGYVFFFAHALRELGLPSTISGDAPDGEVRREPALRTTRNPAGRNRHLTLAA